MALHTCLGFQQVTSLSSATALTVPDGTHYALLQSETQNVRYRLDGSDPTAAIGALIIAGAHQPHYIADIQRLKAAKFIEASASAKLNVHYFGCSD